MGQLELTVPRIVVRYINLGLVVEFRLGDARRLFGSNSPKLGLRPAAVVRNSAARQVGRSSGMRLCSRCVCDRNLSTWTHIGQHGAIRRRIHLYRIKACACPG